MGATQRILSILQFYGANYENADELSKYLSVYKHLVNDFHHILDRHLNDANISQKKPANAFAAIFGQIMRWGMRCNVSKCAMHRRNNRVRELTQIDERSKDIAMFMDILDGIHCHFLHSVDIGYRALNGKSEPIATKNYPMLQNSRFSSAFVDDEQKGKDNPDVLM